MVLTSYSSMSKHLLLIMLFLFSIIFLFQGCSSNKNSDQQIPVLLSEPEQPSFVPAENGNVVIVEQTKTVEEDKGINQPFQSSQQPAASPVKVPPHAPKREILRRGTFAPKAHPVEGGFVMYYSDDEEKTGTDEETLLVLELNNEFSSAYGPDLHVYLSSIANPDTQHVFEEGEFADLGSLKKLSGKQYYVVPEYAQTIEYDNVAIYSPGFNEVYGVAYLY